jgi:hypothetical protein
LAINVVFWLAADELVAIVGKVNDTENRLGRAPSPTMFERNSVTLKAIVFS